VGNLLTQGSDLAVLGVLVLLTLFNGGLEILDLISEAGGLSSNLGTSLLDSGNCVFFSTDPGKGAVNLFLKVILGSLNAVGFVNDVLNSRATR